LRDGWPVAALVFLAAVAIAYACLKFYDEPTRDWLKKKVLVDGSNGQLKGMPSLSK
jgi:peptidoglycan/LPS O-acetylase OafA/YrhL